ncbi:MAG: tRNA pseudouridine(55) synthase TruB [Clostridia bacterium]|nr:tRNA pseudouridine(55) synthase TruB [Clostridia bacterium]
MENKFNESGIVLVNKPAGISSNHVVNIVKRALGAKKCGHLGTLDLEGAGLLPVTVNNATKLFDYYLKKDKTYETVFIFGFETDTLDTSGQILKQKECDISINQVEKSVKEMIGKQSQMPPLYSAKKVGGKVAYKEARKGNTIELHPKEIEIFDFRVLQKIDKNTFKFEISCSSGTYIRSVCRDLAEKLSTYGSMQSILRTRCGVFCLKDAYSVEDVNNNNFNMLSCEDLFDYDKIVMSKEEIQKLLNGQILHVRNIDGSYRIFGEDKFLGIANVEEGNLKLKLRL